MFEIALRLRTERIELALARLGRAAVLTRLAVLTRGYQPRRRLCHRAWLGLGLRAWLGCLVRVGLVRVPGYGWVGRGLVRVRLVRVRLAWLGLGWREVSAIGLGLG